MMKKREEKPVNQEVKPKPIARIVGPSEKLALLLRKESMLAARVRKAQDDLRVVEQEISGLWEERQEQSRGLLGDIGEE
jgi:hypothetical protein